MFVGSSENFDPRVCKWPHLPAPGTKTSTYPYYKHLEKIFVKLDPMVIDLISQLLEPDVITRCCYVSTLRKHAFFSVDAWGESWCNLLTIPPPKCVWTDFNLLNANFPINADDHYNGLMKAASLRLEFF